MSPIDLFHNVMVAQEVALKALDDAWPLKITLPGKAAFVGDAVYHVAHALPGLPRYLEIFTTFGCLHKIHDLVLKQEYREVPCDEEMKKRYAHLGSILFIETFTHKTLPTLFLVPVDEPDIAAKLHADPAKGRVMYNPGIFFLPSQQTYVAPTQAQLESAEEGTTWRLFPW
jgi:hypothetical protein